jgi:hypothetical protein
MNTSRRSPAGLHVPPVCTRFTTSRILTSTHDISTTMSSINSEVSVSESQSPPLLNSPTKTPQLHRTTIARCAKGEIQPHEDYRKQCGLLTQIQEQQLLQFINDLTQRGLPPDHFNVRVFAQNICGKWPGKNWASSFVQQQFNGIKIYSPLSTLLASISPANEQITGG